VKAQQPSIIQRLAGQSGLIMLGNLFTLFVGFPFQIYLAKTLGAEQLGALGLFEAIAQTVGPLLGFGLGFTLVRFVPQQVELGQHRHVRMLMRQVYFLTTLCGIIGAVLVAVGGVLLLRWMPELVPYQDLFPLVGLMTLLGMLVGISQQALRAFFDIPHMVWISSFLQLSIKVAITIVLLWWGWALMGYLLAVVASAGVALLGMLWGVRKHLRRLAATQEEITPQTRKSWRAYASTMYGNTLLGIAAAPAERFLLAGTIDLASVGVLMAVRQLQAFPQVLLQVIITVIGPMFVAARTKGHQEEVEHIYHISTDWVCRLGFPLLVFLLVFGEQVLALYGAAFASAGRWPLFLLLLAQVVNLSCGPLGIMLNMLGHENRMLQLNTISNGIFFACLLLLVPFLGLLGVALGGLSSMLFLNLAAIHTMKRRLDIPWWSPRYQRLLLPLVVITLAALALSATSGVATAWSLVAALLGLYLIFFMVYAMRGFSHEDREVYGLLLSRLNLGHKQN
jgi:stage V sporulation protein B